MDEKRQQNNTAPALLDKSHNHFQSRVAKLARALYAITNHIDTAEPLRLTIRQSAMSLIKDTYKTGGFNKLSFIKDMNVCKTYLDIAAETCLLSPHNKNVLDDVLVGLQQDIQDLSQTPQQPSVAEMFDGEDEVAVGRVVPVAKTPKTASNVYASQPPVQSPKRASKKKDSDRELRIKEVLRAKGSVTIKDVSVEITDCSEKTIQRELLRLVENGVVEKQGERRWSTYSLKQL